MQFRDVFEVDGKPIRDRAGRLAKLFLEPSASAQQQVQAINAESARYNIGGDHRANVNLPVLALSVLEPRTGPGFRSRDGGRTSRSPAACGSSSIVKSASRTMIRTSRRPADAGARTSSRDRWRHRPRARDRAR